MTKKDKGNTTVISRKDEYIKKIEDLIKEGPYKQVEYDYTNRYQTQIKKCLKGATYLNDRKKRGFIETNSEAPIIKCQLKLHKDGMPLRPRVSFINSPSYKLSKEISKLLKKIYESDTKYSIGNTKEVIENLKNTEINEQTRLVSLDVKDMLTNIPVKEAIEIVRKNRLNQFQKKEQLIGLLAVCLKQNYFRFNNKFYTQTDALPIGSPLSPVIADVYKNEFEKSFMIDTKYKEKIKMWVRYVDDILIILEGNNGELEEFIYELNNKKQQIKFQK